MTTEPSEAKTFDYSKYQVTTSLEEKTIKIKELMIGKMILFILDHKGIKV